MNTINVKEFLDFLQLYSLDGTIKELVIETDLEGVSVIKAVDISDIIFILTSKNIGLPANTDIGFSDISKVIKYLSMLNSETVKFELDKNTIKFDGGKQGKLKLNLLAKEVVPTYVTNSVEEIREKLLDSEEKLNFTINEEEIKNLLSYINLCGSEYINLVHSKDDNKIKIAGSDSEKKYEFELELGNTVSGNIDVELSVFSKYFTSILSNIVKHTGTFTISIANEKPLLFLIGNNIISLVGIVE